MTGQPPNDGTPTASLPAVDEPPPPPRYPIRIGERPGDFIGPYKLLDIIGEGGFGTVFLAERREPMVQRVALKVIKPGMDTRGVIARFEQERQALAVMDHPNVAKVLDGGVTASGRPYFVMEHVKGEPITDFCDRHRLTIKQRLELFIPVCEAVQHAHMKGIIHRDIKPSNILVAITGDAARNDGVVTHGMLVKVIDFGVAKAISHTLTDKTIFTEHGQIIGTPEYMSPEQAEMGAIDIDTRTDVYSLGVVLYELLSGTLPFDSKSLRSAGYAEIQRIIREVDPPRPSTKLSTVDDATGAAIAKARQAEREKIAGELRRELEWIPLRALRKDRARRYPSAESLAADVRRYMNGQPLEAAPESRAYLLRKAVGRNKGPIGAVGACLIMLALGLAGTMWQAHEARRERDLARSAQSLAMLSQALSQELNSSTLDSLLTAIATREQLGASYVYSGESLIGHWMLAELLLDNGNSSSALVEFDVVLANLDSVERLGMQGAIVGEANAVLPGKDFVGSFEEIRAQVQRGRAVAFAVANQWNRVVDELKGQVADLTKHEVDKFLLLHAERDLALALARAEEHAAAISAWDKFTEHLEAVGPGLGLATGLFRRYSAGVTVHSPDFLPLELDLANSFIESGRFADAEQLLLACESSWRQALNDAAPLDELDLRSREFRLVTGIPQTRDSHVTSAWNEPISLLVKLYVQWNKPDLASLWRERLDSMERLNKPPRRWS